MKLYNKSRIPNEILEPLLIAAGRCVGAKTSSVVIKITQGRRCRVSGIANSACYVNTWHLKRVSKWKSERVSTNGGWFKLTLPYVGPHQDALTQAEQVFEVTMHEWKHIADYQTGKWTLPWSSRGSGGRRPIHDRRPEELRAINAVDDAITRGATTRYQDLIIALALAMERAN